MDATWSFEIRSVFRASRIAPVLAGLMGAAALAGIYPVAATIATAMTTTFKIDTTEPPAPVAVSTAAAERNSLGLRFIRLPAVATPSAL
jgi:hypothetical protein